MIAGAGASAHGRERAAPTPRRWRARAGARLAALALVATTGCTGSEPRSPDRAGGVTSARAGGPRAPLGVYHGAVDVAGVMRFSARLGRPLELVHEYLDKSSWTSITSVGWVAEPWSARGYGGRVLFTVPMLPDSGGSLAAGADGRYDDRFRTLARRLVADGHAGAILRIGHEFNGDWYRWSIAAPGAPELYARYWRRIVTAMRAVPGARFRFDWSPVAGSSARAGGGHLEAERAYPGDAYVDFIGLDVFDQSWLAHRHSAPRRWLEYRSKPNGLDWHVRFAAARGKPMSFPEWALARRRDGRGGGDSPYFVARMADWIERHPVAYHAYFEHRDHEGQFGVFSGAFPRAAAEFVRRFGSPRRGPGGGCGDPDGLRTARCRGGETVRGVLACSRTGGGLRPRWPHRPPPSPVTLATPCTVLGEPSADAAPDRR